MKDEKNITNIWKEDKGFILFCVFLLLTAIVFFTSGYTSGYFTKQLQITNSNGLSFSCNRYTSNHLGINGCNATITTLPGNVTIHINSNFDELKYVG